MDIAFGQALNAYKQRLESIEMEAGEDPFENDASQVSFGDMLGDALSSVVDVQKTAETMKLESITGKVELSELVTSVANAELTLNTVVAIRDRVISAYQDITRMPI